MSVSPAGPGAARRRLSRNAVCIAAQLCLAGTALPAFAQTAATTNTTADNDGHLAPLTVQAHREPAAGSTTVIGTEELERNGTIDMGGVVRNQPLVSAPGATSGGGNVWDGAGTTGYNVRGVEGNRVSLDVDGIQLPPAAPRPDGNAANSFGVGRDYIDPEMFREVRIDSGTTPAARSGAQGLGGGVGFITKSPVDYLQGDVTRYGAYKLGYSSASRTLSNAVTAAARLDKVQVLGIYSRRDGHEAKNNSAVAPNPDDWHSDALLTKFRWADDPVHQFGLTLDLFRRHNDRVYDNKTSTTYPNGATQQAVAQRARISLDHDYSPGIGTHALFDTLKTRLYLQTASEDDDTQAPYVTGGQTYQRFLSTSYDNDNLGATVDARKLLGTHLLSYGAGLDQGNSKRPWSELRTNAAGAVVSTSTGSKNRMADTDTTRLSAYMRDEYSFEAIGRRATLTPGLRAEYWRMKPDASGYATAVTGAASQLKTDSDTNLLPGLSLALEMQPGLDAYAQYQRGVRIPTAAEKTGTYDSFSYTGGSSGYAVLGNPDLKQETSDAFELGIKGAAAPGVTVRAAAFYTRYHDFIEYAAQAADPVNLPTVTFGLYRPENIGRANIWGGEFSTRLEGAAWSGGLRGYSLELAGGVTQSNATNTSTGAKGRLASVAPAKVVATLGYTDPGKRFGVFGTVTGVKARQAQGDVIASSTTSTFAVPGFGVLDFSAFWNLSPKVRLNAGLYNLTDKKYWNYATVRALPNGTAAQRTEIDRVSMPGRNLGVSLNVIF
ncbi:TonB-dependent hemoglobin/transferrin/lactoferrin family receptor [Xylophilus rhododendri]|uniref:TonB-dependent hemoglobin/transferrin/lactoferrin family receptor n=1 Tax=Xylophilus rhododendri TaxID=2697032 RepID=A0A857J9M8_9BURK|nr:TonB-dependent hemoglobin/transferrin/lactoferrin family receptor [Xylophilus rhododendri]QHJ00607.1 TonB-dependent hemoglobin/transferrin/lactoferrin family receptor [Xylophilus rhododendri]